MAREKGWGGVGVCQSGTLYAPTVVTERATSITQTSATLNASVNPNAGNVTECKFEYGTSASYGASAPCSALPGERRRAR